MVGKIPDGKKHHNGRPDQIHGRFYHPNCTINSDLAQVGRLTASPLSRGPLARAGYAAKRTVPRAVHVEGADTTKVVDRDGTSCSVVTPLGQRTRSFRRGLLSE
jgi:hypothetical protein